MVESVLTLAPSRWASRKPTAATAKTGRMSCEKMERISGNAILGCSQYTQALPGPYVHLGRPGEDFGNWLYQQEGWLMSVLKLTALASFLAVGTLLAQGGA